MRVARVTPITQGYYRKPKTVDMQTYKRVKAEVEEHQPDAEASFNRMSQVLAKVFPWAIVLFVIYLAAQISRALVNGWPP